MDHSDPDAWRRLCTMLSRSHVPRPTDECGFVDCEPGWMWTPRITDHDLWVVVAGRGRAVIGGRRIALRPRSALVLRPGDTGTVVQDPADRLTVVYCHFGFHDGTAPAALPAEWLPSRHLRLSHDSTVIRDLQHVVRRVRDPHPAAATSSAAALLHVLLDVYREDAGPHDAPDGHEPRVRQVADRLRREPGLRLPLREAAAGVGLSPVHFSRLFRRSLGTSYRDFVLENRLRRARELLAESPLPVHQIAAMLGYGDPFLFSRQIRRRFGVPPTRLRHPRDGA
ncbi:AraC family transcriptional regulator [Streptomyces sp. NPDC058576]|uniref:AraC family transcriptional regulator n=1 Tax=Streptomyces sp. NPDC058576 TaxID=3346547 RepID=UPI003664B648